ncbi:hypothetical protein ILYODFUR_010026 [Ilyodon furcidens]|uniref:Uncharacterized protein n=1 Tax=Ilyodon furcidens TaxID=33524 RepID=A0ABV0USU9_9TELE
MHTLIHTPKGNLERPINLTSMSLDCGRKPACMRENPRMHWENMQTPCRKTPRRESNPGPSCCKTTELPTAPPCSPILVCFPSYWLAPAPVCSRSFFILYHPNYVIFTNAVSHPAGFPWESRDPWDSRKNVSL